MAGVFSPPPERNTSGNATDWPWQPLADCGAGNPFFYHSFYDDMDTGASITGAYTKTLTGAGTIAATPGDGGLALFTTAAVAGTDLCSIQLPAAGFTLTKGKKLFFETRFQVSSAINVAFNVGLIQTTVTPFTVVDGIWFGKASGGTVLTINHSIASVVTTATIPAAAYTLADATFIELGFYMDRNGDILAFVDTQLVGYIPQSGSGAVQPNAGVVSRISPAALATVNLNPTIALASGVTAARTMTLDFVSVQKER